MIEPQGKLPGSSSQRLFEFPLVDEGLNCGLRFSLSGVMLFYLKARSFVFDFAVKGWNGRILSTLRCHI